MSIERDDEGQIKRLDWANITENIYKKADRLILAMPMVFNCGISREDVVHSLLEKFFASPDHLGWKPTKSKVVEGRREGSRSWLDQLFEPHFGETDDRPMPCFLSPCSPIS
jgi:hypothetical protein